MIRVSPVDTAFRTEWAPVVATLVRETGSLELAEDAVSEAFVEASIRWRKDGAPKKPGAWILTTARRKAIDKIRRSQRFKDRLPYLVDQPEYMEPNRLIDDQLALIAGCCHPALKPEAQVALTLRYVSGLSTEQIARSFLVPIETMAKRLTRAKKKVAEAAIPLTVPEPDRLDDRLRSILGVIYAVFTEGHSSAAGQDLIRGNLCDEAIWLATLLCDLALEDSETHGLAALVLLTDARRFARTDPDGMPILLEDQDRSKWDQNKIASGLEHLAVAQTAPGIGPYQLLAGIAGLHAVAKRSEDTPWAAIVRFYNGLLRLDSSPVLYLNRAAAVAAADGAEAGLDLMDQLGDQLVDYQYFHSARAALLAKAGDPGAAVDAYERAISLTANDAERRWMQGQMETLRNL